MHVDACPGCRLPCPGDVVVEVSGGPAAAGCRDLFTELLARSYEGYERAGLRSVHQLVVDAHVAAHPGGTSRRQVQAVALSLMTLQLFLEDGVDPVRGSGLHAVMADHLPDVHRLAPPATTAPTTVRTVLEGGLGATGDVEVQAHVELAWRWAEQVWGTWVEHHTTVRAWNASRLPGRVRLP